MINLKMKLRQLELISEFRKVAGFTRSILKNNSTVQRSKLKCKILFTVSSGNMK